MSNSETSTKTIKMSLARALKEKSRLSKKLLEARATFKPLNSVAPDYVIEEDPVAAYAAMSELQGKYLAIKKAIARGNAGISDQLTEMLVVRAEMAYYATLDCTPASYKEEPVESEDGSKRYNRVKVTHNVIVTAAERAAIKERLQNRLNTLQDEVDEYNATHTVEVCL